MRPLPTGPRAGIAVGTHAHRLVVRWAAGGDLIVRVPDVTDDELRALLHCDLPYEATPTPVALYVGASDVLPSTATILPCACAKSVGVP